MNFIKNLFDKKGDDMAHLQFQKFSKGEFRNRAIVQAKRTGKKYTVKTSAEFANELVKAVATKVGSANVGVTGAVVSTSDLTEELNFTEKKQFQGVKRYLIDSEMTGEEILGLIEKFPKAFVALSFETPDEETKLKVKPKAPKSGKPGKGDEAPKADFCKLITTDAELGKSFVFDKPDFKKAELKHTFFVESMQIPEELKKSEDFAMVREAAKRVGRIVREGIIDEEDYKKEFEFVA